jgi:hypothetical protein
MYYRGKATNALVAVLKDLEVYYQQIKSTEKNKKRCVNQCKKINGFWY